LLYHNSRTLDKAIACRPALSPLDLSALSDYMWRVKLMRSAFSSIVLTYTHRPTRPNKHMARTKIIMMMLNL
jgi:hypothetical protein